MHALDHPERRVGTLQLLAQQREAQVVHPGAAVLLGDRRPQEAQLREAPEELAWVPAGLVPGPDVRQELALCEGACGIADEQVLVAQREVDDGALGRSMTCRDRSVAAERSTAAPRRGVVGVVPRGRVASPTRSPGR